MLRAARRCCKLSRKLMATIPHVSIRIRQAGVARRAHDPQMRSGAADERSPVVHGAGAKQPDQPTYGFLFGRRGATSGSLPQVANAQPAKPRKKPKTRQDRKPQRAESGRGRNDQGHAKKGEVEEADARGRGEPRCPAPSRKGGHRPAFFRRERPFRPRRGARPAALRQARKNGCRAEDGKRKEKKKKGGGGTRIRSIHATGKGRSPSPRESALVGTTGFEPATSCSQSRRATRLRHVPTKTAGASIAEDRRRGLDEAQAASRRTSTRIAHCEAEGAVRAPHLSKRRAGRGVSADAARQSRIGRNAPYAPSSIRARRARRAFPLCDTAFFSCGRASASVRSPPNTSGRNKGS